MTDNDKKNIYNSLVNLLTINCNTCLDKHQMEKILLCAFKLELIEYANGNDMDANELWESLARTLGLKLGDESGVRIKNQCNCSNGMCSLC